MKRTADILLMAEYHGLYLSDRDCDILDLVADHRFLRADQIRRLHFADLGTEPARARACSRVLRRLAAAKLIRLVERRVGGVKRGSAAGVWCLGPVGYRVMKRVRVRVTRPHEFGRPEFLEHTLAIAEARVRLVEASRAGQFELAKVQLEPDAWRGFPGPLGAPLSLRPDIFVITAAGDYETHWFVEIDRGTESMPRITKKCARYQAHFQSGIEQATHGVYPVVQWVVPDRRRAESVRRVIDEDQNLESQIFRVVIEDEFIAEITAETTST